MACCVCLEKGRSEARCGRCDTLTCRGCWVHCGGLCPTCDVLELNTYEKCVECRGDWLPCDRTQHACGATVCHDCLNNWRHVCAGPASSSDVSSEESSESDAESCLSGSLDLCGEGPGAGALTKT